MEKNVIIFFDTEYPPSRLGKINFEENLIGILEVLGRFKAKAVFNVCGVLGEDYPDLMKTLIDEGQELACHGYNHEDFSQLTPKSLDIVLRKAENVLQNRIGIKPIGIRSPWCRQSGEIYRTFKRSGYLWASNLAMIPSDLKTALHRISSSRTLLVHYGSILARAYRRKRWGTNPFMRFGMLEFPMLSSSDVLLFDMPSVDEETPQNQLLRAFHILTSQYRHSDEFFNLNFHPWCIGSSNRLLVLEEILSAITASSDSKFVLPRELLMNRLSEKDS